MKDNTLDLRSEGLHYTGIAQEDNEYFGKGTVRFIQSFPDMFLGHKTEEVVIRPEDIDKVIQFLQECKTRI